MNPRIKLVSTSSDYKLHLEFTNGERGVYDCTSLLDFGVFKELKDLENDRSVFDVDLISSTDSV